MGEELAVIHNFKPNQLKLKELVNVFTCNNLTAILYNKLLLVDALHNLTN